MQETFNLVGSYLISDYFQIGSSLPYRVNTRKTDRSSESSRGFSDFELSMAYEFLPERFYNPIKPRGFIFLKHKAPLEKSVYESEKAMATDALSSGLHNTGFGFVFIKRWNFIDLNLSTELSRPWDRNIDGRVVSKKMGQAYSLEGGISRGDLRIGSSLTHQREGNQKYFWETGLNLSYVKNLYSFSVNYNDQTFFANAVNTTLNKSISLSVIRFFDL